MTVGLKRFTTFRTAVSCAGIPKGAYSSRMRRSRHQGSKGAKRSKKVKKESKVSMALDERSKLVHSLPVFATGDFCQSTIGTKKSKGEEPSAEKLARQFVPILC